MLNLQKIFIVRFMPKVIMVVNKKALIFSDIEIQTNN